MNEQQMILVAGMDQGWAAALDGYLSSTQPVDRLIELLGSNADPAGLAAEMQQKPRLALLVRQLANLALGEVIRRAGERFDEAKKVTP